MAGKNLPVVIDATPVEPKASVGGGLAGAERNSRELFRWNPAIISPDQQINPVKDMADARARDSVQNDGYAMGAVYTHRDSIVGGQYRLNAQPDFETLGADEAWSDEFQRVVEARFNLVADSPRNWLDASGANNFTGLIRLAVGGFLMTGEVLGTAEWMKKNGLRPCQTAIQMISPTRLSNPDGQADDRFLRRGVKRDFFGRAIGYYIRSAFPTEIYDDRAWQWRYVPATKPWGREQVIHIIEQLQPEQTRGVADMVSVLKEMRMTKKFQDVTLQNAVVNATYAAAIESELPKEVVYGSMGAGQAGFGEMLGQYMSALSAYVGSTDNIAIDGVKMPHLFPGTKLSLRPMGTPGGVGTGFEESLLRHVAAALGLSYEQFSRDYSKTNYSSARASMTETWKFMQSRKKIVADRFATLIYSLWLEEEINAGNIPLPPGKGPESFYDPIFREAYTACEWIGASRGQIDEMKETQAAILRIKSGLSTYEIESARLGLDFRRIFRQRAREEKLKTELNLNFDSDATKPGANQSLNSMRDGKSGNNETQDDEDDEL
jgi:lambda family phage portal protein